MRLSTVRITSVDNLTAGAFFLLEHTLYQKIDWDKAKEFSISGWLGERRLLGTEKVQPVDITGGKVRRDMIEV